jgi:hypothetical protein
MGGDLPGGAFFSRTAVRQVPDLSGSRYRVGIFSVLKI